MILTAEELCRCMNRERIQTASAIRDIASRIGPAAVPEWVKEELQSLANQLEVWANISRKETK